MSDTTMIATGRSPLLAVLPKLAATALMLVLAAVWLGPVLLIVMTSIKSNADFLAEPFALPKSPTFAVTWSIIASPLSGPAGRSLTSGSHHA